MVSLGRWSQMVGLQEGKIPNERIDEKLYCCPCSVGLLTTVYSSNWRKTWILPIKLWFYLAQIGKLSSINAVVWVELRFCQQRWQNVLEEQELHGKPQTLTAFRSLTCQQHRRSTKSNCLADPWLISNRPSEKKTNLKRHLNRTSTKNQCSNEKQPYATVCPNKNYDYFGGF